MNWLITMTPQIPLKRLYQVFSRYPHPSGMEGCPCCTSPGDARPMLSVPLQRIPPESLEKFAFKALTTWGMVDDYKYFLPRILELSLSGLLVCDLEIVLGKLAYGGYRSWPSAEQQAVEEIILSCWRGCLAEFDRQTLKGMYNADSLLCGAAQFTDVTPFLALADSVAPGFRAAYRDDCANGAKRKLSNAFWNRESENYRLVHDWVFGQ
jgi:hypothetical protein